jgi:hypothetical protein
LVSHALQDSTLEPEARNTHNTPPPLVRHFSQQPPKVCKACVARGGFWQVCRHQPKWTNKFREFVSFPPSGARRGGGSNATTSQGRQQEAAVRGQAEAPVERRQGHDKIQWNNQPEWMRDNHTREQEGHNGAQGSKVVVGGMTTIEGGRGAIKKRMTEIKRRWCSIWQQKCQ